MLQRGPPPPQYKDSSMTQWFAPLGALLGALAVAAGAFGAHGLRARLDARMLEIWQTAASYHLVHALALVVAGLVAAQKAGVAPKVAGAAFLLGVLVFSGTLYALALTDLRWLGAITPLGGVAFIVGWVALAVALWPT